jgi:hypothetical protein
MGDMDGLDVVDEIEETDGSVYMIRRFFQDRNIPTEVIARGLTLREAQEHCQNPETSSSTCTTIEGRRRTEERGPWFDGYAEE